MPRPRRTVTLSKLPTGDQGRCSVCGDPYPLGLVGTGSNGSACSSTCREQLRHRHAKAAT
jgi:hypothetical protein